MIISGNLFRIKSKEEARLQTKMMKLSKEVIKVLLLIAAGLLIGYLLAPKSDSQYKEELKKQDKQYRASLDSLKTLSEKNRKELKAALETAILLKDTLEIERQKTSYWQDKYAEAKVVKKYTPKELDTKLKKMYLIAVDTGQVYATTITRWNYIMRDLEVKVVSDSLVKQQARELRVANQVISATDTALQKSQERTKIAEGERDSWKGRFITKDKELENEKKDKKRFRRERNVAILTTVGVIVISIL